MFLVETAKVTHYYPWLGTFEERLRQLPRRGQRVGYFYTEPDNSTFRYRVHNMVEALNAASSRISALWFSEVDEPHFLRIVDSIDVLVVCRAQFTLTLARLIEATRRAGKPVMFDTDDLVFHTDFIPLVMDSLDQDTGPEGPWNYWFAYIGRIAATFALCDRAVTTNAFLAARLREASGRPAAVVPNFLNEDQIRVSDRVFRAKAASGYARDDRLHIGYFSGSPSHNRDFAVVAPVLAELLESDPSLVVRLVGHRPSHGELARFGDRIETHAFRDYVNLQRLIGGTEINIAPLQDNVFTNCKSELKFFEAAAVGTLTVASSTFTFRAAMTDGIDGFVAGEMHWKDKLRAAIAVVRGTGGEYAAMAEAGRRTAERYHPARQVAAIEAALFPDGVPA